MRRLRSRWVSQKGRRSICQLSSHWVRQRARWSVHLSPHQTSPPTGAAVWDTTYAAERENRSSNQLGAPTAAPLGAPVGYLYGGPSVAPYGVLYGAQVACRSGHSEAQALLTSLDQMTAACRLCAATSGSVAATINAIRWHEPTGEGLDLHALCPVDLWSSEEGSGGVAEEQDHGQSGGSAQGAAISARGTPRTRRRAVRRASVEASGRSCPLLSMMGAAASVQSVRACSR